MSTNPESVPSQSENLEQALPEGFGDRLRSLAERQGISLEAALAQAIRLDEIVLDAKAENAEVLLVKNGRKFAINFR